MHKSCAITVSGFVHFCSLTGCNFAANLTRRQALVVLSDCTLPHWDKFEKNQDLVGKKSDFKTWTKVSRPFKRATHIKAIHFFSFKIIPNGLAAHEKYIYQNNFHYFNFHYFVVTRICSCVAIPLTTIFRPIKILARKHSEKTKNSKCFMRKQKS